MRTFSLLAALTIASGPSFAQEGLPGAGEEPMPAPAAFEQPADVRLTAEGDVYVRGADGSLERIAHAGIVAFEAWCETGTCDIVVRTTSGRRVALGSQPSALTGEVLFARPVVAHPERIGLPEPERTGAFTPGVVAAPPRPTPPPPAADAAPTGPPAAPVAPSAPAPGQDVAGDSPPAPGPGAPPSAWTPGDPAIPPGPLGALDKSLIDKVIKADMWGIRQCYNDLLHREPTAAGRVAIKFVIAKDGTVFAATVKEGNVGDEAFRSCVLQRFMRMRFPTPKDEGIVIVTYPFIFSPG